MHQCLKCILFAVTLHMFRTVFPSITRSSRLYIQQQAYVRQILASAYEMELMEFHLVPPSKQSALSVQDCTYSNRHMSNRYLLAHTRWNS